MARVDDLMIEAVKAAGPKPADTVSREDKKAYSESLSNTIARALAEELRQRGLDGARPGPPGEVGVSGAERRLAGGIGAKKVDVSWATEECGLMLACSIKTIMFRDRRSNAYQKNLANRRGDLLVESTTLHRRFPYAVVAAFFCLDIGAESDGTARRRSTFENAFPRLRLFTRRGDPTGRDEQFERFYLLLVDSNQFAPQVRCWEVNDRENEVVLADAFTDMMDLVVERNFDHYEAVGDGTIRRSS